MRLLKLLVVLTVFFSLSVTVFAHPGKTDSSGGHTDHSTGEYHYHHGYSAHQHYDSDGDGDLDCPHDFKDMTGINSGESSQKETHVARISPNKKNSIVEETEYEDSANSSKKKTSILKTVCDYIWKAIYILFALFFGFMCLLVVIELIVQVFRGLFKR